MGQSCGIGGAKSFDGASDGSKTAPDFAVPRAPRRQRVTFQGDELVPTGAWAAHPHKHAELWGETRVEPALPAQLNSFAVLRRRRATQSASSTLETGTSTSSFLQVPPGPPGGCGLKEDWQRWYRTSQELGRGVSAAVFEAQALRESSRLQEYPGCSSAIDCATDSSSLLPPSLRESLLSPTVICSRGVATAVPRACVPERRRQVAIKRFKKVRSRSFQTELAALLKVGVHPNVVRLFESYEDCDGEDVLILEYCEGGTVFDAYARARTENTVLPELLVARLVRQLLLGLEHIAACGVEHQDVKPENMLLYDVSLEERRAELKLGDFGWAVSVPRDGGTRLGASTPPGQSGDGVEKVPVDGAGSLWYAPPELNPPVELGSQNGQAYKLNAVRVPGRSDMWSVGVVVYLLLVGHNPFHIALLQQTSKAMEQEVLRLVALGQFDTTSKWQQLAKDAKDFIGSMLRASASERIPVQQALRHPYLLRRLRGCAEVAPLEPAWRWAERDTCWSTLDGFQRLCWAAVARSVAEPELHRDVVVSAQRATRATAAAVSRGITGGAQSAYLWQLARELCMGPLGSRLRYRGTAIEVARLAFRYLDVDRDGMLSSQDLVFHILGSDSSAAAFDDENSGPDIPTNADAWSAAHLWVARWGQDGGKTSAGSCDRYRGCAGVGMSGFRRALASSALEGCSQTDVEDFDMEDSDPDELQGPTFSEDRGDLWIMPVMCIPGDQNTVSEVCGHREELCGLGCDARR